ncbi:MAG: DUF763 domain-containing protein [Methanobacteriota archaeon]|nr:MAG: DUF763 domain-containing protein [Euryarchaeota archaeon]
MSMRTGAVDLPLHGGRAPRWLFQRMVGLAEGITEAVVLEYGSDELLRRLSDPYWFQALSCVLGFDWHSSGTTTTTCGALKMAIRPEDHGIAVAGGKGRASRKTQEQIEGFSEAFSLSDRLVERLKYSSRMAAKVDNTCVQDGYQLYHHSFFFTEKGTWAVVQQGMEESHARRYHWLSDGVKDYVNEPQSAICCDERKQEALNMVAGESEEARKVSVDLVKDGPGHLRRYFRPSAQRRLDDYSKKTEHVFGMPGHHPVLGFDLTEQGWKTLQAAYELQPENYEELISLRGMGPKSIRALALISDLVYGTSPSWRDPVKYSYAHGGKDGYPYPVDRDTYDKSIEVLKNAVEEAKIDKKERYQAIKRLGRFV